MRIYMRFARRTAPILRQEFYRYLLRISGDRFHMTVWRWIRDFFL